MFVPFEGHSARSPPFRHFLETIGPFSRSLRENPLVSLDLLGSVQSLPTKDGSRVEDLDPEDAASFVEIEDDVAAERPFAAGDGAVSRCAVDEVDVSDVDGRFVREPDVRSLHAGSLLSCPGGALVSGRRVLAPRLFLSPIKSRKRGFPGGTFYGSTVDFPKDEQLRPLAGRPTLCIENAMWSF